MLAHRIIAAWAVASIVLCPVFCTGALAADPASTAAQPLSPCCGHHPAPESPQAPDAPASTPLCMDDCFCAGVGVLTDPPRLAELALIAPFPEPLPQAALHPLCGTPAPNPIGQSPPPRPHLRI
ncbi:MAG: hypothetical protein IPM64_08320 [Phycisphaerales bacterium]|nr:hypothetical protein [Phycisphaerales bacterium]